jgi:hypothetical protein
MHGSRALLFLIVTCSAGGFAECSGVAPETSIWLDIDQQYSKIEHAMLARDAKALFSAYATDFEAHNRADVRVRARPPGGAILYFALQCTVCTCLFSPSIFRFKVACIWSDCF